MTPFSHRAALCIAATLICLAGCFAWLVAPDARGAMQPVPTRTVCVGRLLIDLPADAHVTLGGAAVDGFDIASYGPESVEAFTKRVKHREQEITAQKSWAGLANLVSTHDVHQHGTEGRIYVFDFRASHYFDNGVKIKTGSVSVDGFARVDGSTFGFAARMARLDAAKDLVKLINQLEPRTSDAVPEEPGFCLDGGFLRNPLLALQGERIHLFAGLPGHDDLGIALTTMAGTPPGPRLLERHRANRAGPYAFLNRLTSALIERRRNINGFDGDELAFKAWERNFTFGYAFDWEAQGNADDVLQPFMALELQTGISQRAGGLPVQSSLSEHALRILWERMSSSVRLRPVGRPPDAIAAMPPAFPGQLPIQGMAQ